MHNKYNIENMVIEQSSGLKRLKPSPHILCLVLPLYATCFLAVGPHPDLFALLWVIPVWLTVVADLCGPQVNMRAENGFTSAQFNITLYLLSGLQLVNISLLLIMASQLNWTSGTEIFTALCNLFAIKVVIGTSSSFSGIVVAHELIHRSKPHLKTLGRLLLSLECYEHFATEHIRGHHNKVGTANDPATAHLGESFNAFWRRTVPAQFKSAWGLENKRLGIDSQHICHKRLLQHRVFQGLLVEFGLILGIFLYFGLTALAAFAIQAYAAVHKLETINYIEHWGLSQYSDNSDKQLSWDTDSWFTLYTLVGLSRHTDHHQFSTRPYQQLCHRPESPKLPYGYFAMVFLTVFHNKRFQVSAVKELESRGLIKESRRVI